MTAIEWTHAPGFIGCTWNPVIGCRHVAEGCRHCYAETMSKRLAAMGQKDYASILTPEGKFNGRAITRPETLADPLRWRKPRMVFVNSMSDLFHEDVPFEFIAAVFGVMAACPQHTFQCLTKRPERALEFFEWADLNIGEPDYFARFFDNTPVRQIYADGRAEPTSDWPLKNVWLGVSVATQADADKNVPVLLKCPTAIRFVSAEPLIESVDLSRALGVEKSDMGMYLREQIHELGGHRALDWVIVGGESGPGARAFDAAWAREIIAACEGARVPCFIKQLGANPCEDMGVEPKPPLDLLGPKGNWLHLKDRKGGDVSEWPQDLRVRQFPPAEAFHG